jgi:hypothetical protein
MDMSSQRTMGVVLLGSQGRRTLEDVDVAAIVLPDTHQFLSIYARWHSVEPAVAQGSLEVSVERLEAQVDGMPHDDWYEYICMNT